jgi:hypothetical protein
MTTDGHRVSEALAVVSVSAWWKPFGVALDKNLQKLQAAIAALDEATKPLADFLMDQATAAMLCRRGLIQ